MRTPALVLTLVLAVQAQAAAVRPAIRPAIREAFDVRYHTGSPRQVLDVFSPREEEGKKRPVVLFVHGGTWMVGDKDFFGVNRNFGRMFARNGYVAVLANYRLSPFVRHPEHAKDVARAYAWVVNNAAKYGGDPSKIVLIGHSAGGHLATLVATDPAYLNDPKLKLTAAQKAALKGVVGISGVYRIPDAKGATEIANAVLKNWESHKGSLLATAAPVLSFAQPVLNPFWIVFGDDASVRKKASPLNHVRKGLPPFLLLYTGAEPPTLDKMAREFAKALTDKGVSADLKYYDDATHRTIMRQLHSEKSDATKAVLDFVKRATK
jgi:acetyl esterase/lipase